MADTAQQAEVRRQLAARGNQLAPRVTPGGSQRRFSGSAARTAANPATRPRPGSSTTTRARSTTRRAGPRSSTRTTPPTPPAEDVGPLGGRRSSRTQPPPDLGDRARRYVQREAGRQWRAVPRLLVVEWLASLAIIAVKPFEPAEPGKATEATIPQLMGVSVVFFLLAAGASISPRASKVANLFGGLVTLVLLLHNHGSVTGAVTTLAKYQAPQTPNIAPSPAAGEPVASATGTKGAAGGIFPTPTGAPSLAQQIISGWRGAVPDIATPNGQPRPTPQPAPGG